jgi:hypothetical protein
MPGAGPRRRIPNSKQKVTVMTDPTQLALSQNDHQPKPLQNGFNPDFPHSEEVDQSSPPSTEVLSLRTLPPEEIEMDGVVVCTQFGANAETIRQTLHF